MAPPPTARRETFELLASLGALTAPALCALTGIPERTAQWRLRQLVEVGLAHERVRPRKGPSQFSLSVRGATAARAQHLAAAALDARDTAALDHLVAVVDLLGACVAHARGAGRPWPARQHVRVGGRLAASFHVDAWIEVPGGGIAMLLCRSGPVLYAAAARLRALGGEHAPVVLVVGAGVAPGTRVRFEDETDTWPRPRHAFLVDEDALRTHGLEASPVQTIGAPRDEATRFAALFQTPPLVTNRDHVVQTGP